MKKIILITILLIFYTVTPANTTIKYVEGQTTGMYYNEVWDNLTEQPIKVYVDLISFVNKVYEEDDSNNFDDNYKIYITGGGGLLAATGMIYSNEKQEMIDSLKKGLEWIRIAKKEKVEINKGLGNFSKPCAPLSEVNDICGINLWFYSVTSNQDILVGVAIKIIDIKNPMFDKIVLRLEEEQVKKLITLLETVPDTLEEIKKNANKSDLFQ